jgi:hypothetical protein
MDNDDLTVDELENWCLTSHAPGPTFSSAHAPPSRSSNAARETRK